MKIIQNSLLLLLLLAFALARPMDSSEKEGPERGGRGELNELEKTNELGSVALGYPMESTEPSRYPLPKVTTESLLEIIQKFDFNSLDNTSSNLKLGLKQILKYGSITLEAVFPELKIQYQIEPDMMKQIYKSIPLSVLVRLKAPAKIIGALFIAFTSVDAYTLNNEIEISPENPEAESKGNQILDAFNAKTSISHLLPPFGYELDDYGNKNRVNEEYVKILTHPYIFELVWYLSLTESNGHSIRNYPSNSFTSFNRKDILQVIYESSETPEGIKCKNDIFYILKRSLTASFEFLSGYPRYQIIEYLTRIGTELDILTPRVMGNIFQIKDEDKKNRLLNYLHRNKAAIWIKVFDKEAIEGRLENIQWLVEHGYQGYSALVLLNRPKLNDNQEKVRDYLSLISEWKAVQGFSGFSRGNYQGVPQPF